MADANYVIIAMPSNTAGAAWCSYANMTTTGVQIAAFNSGPAAVDPGAVTFVVFGN